ncbi:MAG TPA: class I SAM-dependent methyltransferase [Candidatus Paceibacterota bacterium]|nr:class I SAM-dependent methyltransferase [Candidatus Paceibacterota bacterium]HPT17875.1 class I SAM-dependent methyltransferase [Candidatus Paceibacterota bacterium]
MEDNIKIFYSKEKFDYELLDTGEGQKLEKVGKYIFARPFEDAIWKKSQDKKWREIDGEFISSKKGEKAGWKIKNNIEKKWIVSYNGIQFSVMPTPFRHFGFFPEQASHWDFIEEKISHAKQPIRFLNLFGYTGVASLFALRSGAEVTHVDASKQSIAWAKENQTISGLEKMPMRIICDDVLKFLEREAKRGNKYDCVIMDPPKFGRGPKGEVWKLEEMLPKLLNSVKKVLSDKPLFVILTSYAVDSSSVSLGYALQEIMKNYSGSLERGELCVLEKSNNRFISLANTAVWKSFEK